jgi:hypothetical protein
MESDADNSYTQQFYKYEYGLYMTGSLQLVSIKSEVSLLDGRSGLCTWLRHYANKPEGHGI